MSSRQTWPACTQCPTWGLRDKLQHFFTRLPFTHAITHTHTHTIDLRRTADLAQKNKAHSNVKQRAGIEFREEKRITSDMVKESPVSALRNRK